MPKGLVGAKVQRLNFTSLITAAGQYNNRNFVIPTANHRQRLIALYIGQTQIAEKLSARIAVLLKLYLYGKIERFSHPWSWS
jgi:hypothetical protein